MIAVKGIATAQLGVIKSDSQLDWSTLLHETCHLIFVPAKIVEPA